MMISLQNIINIIFFISRAIEILALLRTADNRDLQEANADQEQHLGNAGPSNDGGNDGPSNDGSNDRSQQSGQQ